MRQLFIIFCAMVTIMMEQNTASASQIENKESVLGYWLVKKKDVLVKIEPCKKDASLLCGFIVWLDPEAKLQKDELNPNKSKRSRALCGIQVMWRMKADAKQKGVYSGRIYKANSGSYYDAEIKRVGDNLSLRGYIGVPLLGKTSVFTPQNPKNYKLCRP